MHNGEIKANSCHIQKMETIISYLYCVQVIPPRVIVSVHTSSITISAALRTDSMTSPRALHTPTWPGVSPLSRAHGAAPDMGLERGSLARELGQKGVGWYGDSQQVWGQSRNMWYLSTRCEWKTKSTEVDWWRTNDQASFKRERNKGEDQRKTSEKAQWRQRERKEKRSPGEGQRKRGEQLKEI